MKLKYKCDHVVEIEQEPRHHLVIANDFVRGFAVEIAPHDRTLCHHHPNDYLLYVACDAEIVSAARGEEPKKLSYRDGECELASAGMTHVVENLSDTPFRNVVTELLPRAGKLRRCADPKVVAGKASITRLLDDDRAAIFAIGLDAGSEVTIEGPAVVASPYEVVVELKETDGHTTSLQDFRSLAWLAPKRTAILKNTGEELVRAVIFQVGLRQDGSALNLATPP